MPDFRFKAIDAQGKVVNGVSSAQDPTGLSAILQGQGLFLMESDEVHPPAAVAAAEAPPKKSLLRWRRGDKVSLKDLSFLTAQMSIMIRSALPIVESLELLAAQTVHPKLKAILKEISRSVSEGLPLSQAFARYPEVFDDVYVSLLAAGEIGGDLDQMLDRLSSHLAFRVKMAQSIRSVLAYPLIVVLTTMGVVSFLVLFVLPTFMEIFKQLAIELPLPTKILMFVSEGLRRFWWVVILAAAGARLSFKGWLKDPENVRRFARFQLGLPVIGTLIQNIVMTRTLRTMGSLMDSGVSIMKCLELSRASAGNPIFSDLLDDVALDVRDGKTLSSSFAQSPFIPPVVIGMIATGERTGTLPEVVSRVAAFYETETESAIKDLFAALEPLFILGLGLMVGGVAVSVLMPLFDVAQGVK
jgi:type IV pilus assembly protein PilC